MKYLNIFKGARAGIQYSQMSGPAQYILIRIACGNTSLDVSIVARNLKFGLNFYLHPLFVYLSREGIGASDTLTQSYAILGPR